MARQVCSRCGEEYDGEVHHGPGYCGPVHVMPDAAARERWWSEKLLEEQRAALRMVERAEERTRQLEEALQLLGGVHPDTVGDWEHITPASQREKSMRHFARAALDSAEADT